MPQAEGGCYYLQYVPRRKVELRVTGTCGG